LNLPTAEFSTLTMSPSTAAEATTSSTCALNSSVAVDDSSAQAPLSEVIVEI